MTDLKDNLKSSLPEMIYFNDDHSSCGDPCLWKKLYSDTKCISTGDLGSVILNSDEPEALVFTRSVYTQAQENQTSSTKEKHTLKLNIWLKIF